MKDYKEMTKCVLEARDAYEAKRGKKKIKTQEIDYTNCELNNIKVHWFCCLHTHLNDNK